MQKWNLYNPLLVEYNVCEKIILYKYQVALIVFGSFLLLNKISKDTRKY
jgi:hypothetical protein